MKRVRIFLWLLVALALAGFAYLQLRPAPEQAGGSGSAVSALTLGGPFTLTGADGKPFSSQTLSGKPYVIFFGFTHCPDVCPTTLARLVRLRQQLGGDGNTPAILFVSVDPERDGPAEVGKYATLFNAPITGLTGTPAQIAQVKKQFGIFSKKVLDGSGGYSVDHTATALLFGSDGKFVATIAPEEPDSSALDKLKRIAG
ncbi:SCO family protein [Sphingomonas piscis]|uniref:SCO family protein n=1 Tax=Sphingomonas piscis TaxID=2714943 RepID=A0A6G7YN63_9SPHN|nr:SCO family protein [Sphingomonas piscis]QIK78185.1 SCO family protein [Sphingomonas piscis]